MDRGIKLIKGGIMDLKELICKLDDLISNANEIDNHFQYGNEREVSAIFFRISTLIETIASKMDD